MWAFEVKIKGETMGDFEHKPSWAWYLILIFHTLDLGWVSTYLRNSFEIVFIDSGVTKHTHTVHLVTPRLHLCQLWKYVIHTINKLLKDIHTLRVHYTHAAANLNSGYSKYAKAARVHYFCTIALRTSHGVLTRAWASRRVDLRERRVDSISKRVVIFCW